MTQPAAPAESCHRAVAAERSLCLVTGGSGFIGSHLVRLLADRGRRVRNLDLTRSPECDARAEFVRGSVLDRGVVRELLTGVDTVFHLAGNPNLWAADKSSFYRTNLDGTRVVLEESARAGIRRLVYTSTESILKGHRGGERTPIDERLERTVNDMPGPYCRSKFLAEQEALAAARRGLPVVVVNPTLPIGPGDYRRTPPTRMLIDFLNARTPAYYEFSLNMIDVRDVAEAHILAAERGRIGERYILGAENLRLSELLVLLQDLSGVRMPRTRIPYGVALAYAAISEFLADYVTRRPPRAPLTGVRLAGANMGFDSSKAVRELGLRPRPVRDALAAALVWLVELGFVRRGTAPRVATP